MSIVSYNNGYQLYFLPTRVILVEINRILKVIIRIPEDKELSTCHIFGPCEEFGGTLNCQNASGKEQLKLNLFNFQFFLVIF